MDTDAFDRHLRAFRPRLHRYCARMAGSAVDGEDVMQDAIVKALQALRDGAAVESPEAWLLRIAHHACLDFLRGRSRRVVVPLDDDIADPAAHAPDIAAVGFQTFLRLPELQRGAVILKDVLGHSIEEIAEIVECAPAAAKSALQRGRSALARFAQEPPDTRLPLMPEDARRRMMEFVSRFRAGDFDAIRAMLAEDVKLELVNRLNMQGRAKTGTYFTRYAEEPKWRFAFGAVEGRPAMLVFDATGTTARPSHFVLLEWHADKIAAIRDFLFTPYILDDADWVRLA